jgi:hypothetical protein
MQTHTQESTSVAVARGRAETPIAPAKRNASSGHTSADLLDGVGDQCLVFDLADLSANPEVGDVFAVQAELEIVVGEGLSEMIIGDSAGESVRAILASQCDGFDRLAEEALHEREFLLFA